LISGTTVLPVRRPRASTSASVGTPTDGSATWRVGRPDPGTPSTSALQRRSWASVLSTTRPLQFVVRSSVGSWMTTGTPSAVSLMSNSSGSRCSAATPKAGRVFSGNWGLPRT
jgi:hypothetical protein